MATLTFHGHATVSVELDDGTRLVIDPFLDNSPVSEAGVDDVEADYILVTHGHMDHIADLIPLAKKTGATVISSHELVSWLATHDIENTHEMSIGGGFTFPFGYVKMTPALHGTKNEGPGGEAFPTMPAGFLVRPDVGRSIYHAGDTALLRDFTLLDGEVDVALLPIGDNYTMGPEDAARAVDFIGPEIVVPIHYDTFPAIEQDADEFAELVAEVDDDVDVRILAPGDTTEF